MSKDMELRVLNAKKNVKDLNCIFGGNVWKVTALFNSSILRHALEEIGSF